jgi:hypothetical protein
LVTPEVASLGRRIFGILKRVGGCKPVGWLLSMFSSRVGVVVYRSGKAV